FAREREVVVRGEALISLEQPFVPLLPGERPQRVMCRMRSLGCSPCTGAVRSHADTVPKIIGELVAVRHSERQLRVIDGKSTLIGRLLYESRAVYEDQLLSVRAASHNRGVGPIDFSLFTDGLR